MPNPSIPGFYACIRWYDEPDDEGYEVFIAQTLDSRDDEDYVFYYAGDYPEEHIRAMFAKGSPSGEEWYIVDEEERNA